ncbi:hypothetical protein VE04_06822 [Pseudogymnoascus sp. 24MN13]|nr:hypothetical protein VE04_06822 [Pseudogymnoascus sp. 24MN13]
MPATPTTKPYLPPHPFTSIRKTRSIIAQQLDQLCFGTSRTQYLLFSSLPPSRFTTLSLGRHDGRHTLPKCVRLTYDAGKEEMVAKLMGEARLESSHRLLEWWIFSRARGMGMDWEELLPEVGFKEGVEGLRWDAGWWVGGSEGEVRVAIIVILHLDEREIVLETWEPARDETRTVSRSAAKQVSRTQEVCISKNGVEGAPLVLRFEKVFGRAAGEGEGDIVFSAQDLGQWARKVWWDDED